jgi:hypothetical protein
MYVLHWYLTSPNEPVKNCSELLLLLLASGPVLCYLYDCLSTASSVSLPCLPLLLLLLGAVTLEQSKQISVSSYSLTYT